MLLVIVAAGTLALVLLHRHIAKRDYRELDDRLYEVEQVLSKNGFIQPTAEGGEQIEKNEEEER